MEEKVELFKERRNFKIPTWVIVLISCVIVSSISSVFTVFVMTRGNVQGNQTRYIVENVENPVVAVAQIAGPSVVGVKVDFFEQDMLGRVSESYEEGSGIVYSSDGYIITNYHVIADSINNNNAVVTVSLSDNEEYEAKIVGYDNATDIAVLKIETEGLTAAKFGSSSKMQVGEQVVAIGNPLGKEFAGSVTVGYISALNRVITTEGRTYKLIQTDAAINPGNSGGALANSKGEVIGINTVKVIDTNVEGLGFAIPMDDALVIVKELIENGKIIRPYIGINGIDLDEKTAKRNKLVEGIYVSQVFQSSPASEAGLQKADVIVAVDGKEIKTKQELNEIKNNKEIGDKIKLKVYRKGEYKEVEITLAGDESASEDITN